MRPLPPDPVFDRSALRALGWSDSAVTRAVAGGRLVAVRRGQLSRPGGTGTRVRAVAAARACAGTVISHRSALEMDDLPIVNRWDGTPELTAPPHRIGSVADAHLYRATLWAQDVTVRDGVAVTSVARTLVDVARNQPTGTAVAAIDAALHRGLATPAQLDDVLLRCWHWNGIRRAHRALRLADARSESPLETVSRLTLRYLRLPPPEPQVVVIDPTGVVVARLDFYWDAFGVAGEADGRSKYDARDVLTAEKRRQELLEDLGLTVVRWGWNDVVRRPHELRDRVESAFARGTARDRSGFRRQWSVRPT